MKRSRRSIAYQPAKFANAIYRMSRAAEEAYGRIDAMDGLLMPNAEVVHLRCDVFSADLCSDDNAILIRIRGTHLDATTVDRFANSVQQLLCNLDYAQEERHGCRIHRGFYREAQAILRGKTGCQSLVETLRRHGAEHKELYLTGHSAGGAVAVVLGYLLHREGVEVDAVHTFGAPRVGCRQFSSQYPVEHFRFEYKSDPIPHLPLSPAAMKLADLIAGKLVRTLSEWIPPLAEYSPDKVEYKHSGKLFFCDWSDDMLHSLDEYWSTVMAWPWRRPWWAELATPIPRAALDISRAGTTFPAILQAESPITAFAHHFLTESVSATRRLSQRFLTA